MIIKPHFGIVCVDEESFRLLNSEIGNDHIDVANTIESDLIVFVSLTRR